MSSSAEIRRAVPADVPALVLLERELFGGDAWSETLLREEVEGPRRRFVVLEDGAGAIAGYAVTMSAGDIVDLLRIGVRPGARRGGIASRLLGELLGGAGDASRMLLEVSAANAGAVEFYRALGFSVIDVRPHYYRDRSDALVMGRSLPTPARSGADLGGIAHD